MNDPIRAQAEREGWGPPFPDTEYRRRREAAADAMTTHGIDVLLVTSPANITYLTGYDMVWHYLRTPCAVALRAADRSTLFFEVAYHRPTVEWHAVVDDAVYFDSFHGAVPVLVDALRQRDWLDGSLGIETWSRNPNVNVLAEVEAGARAAGARVEDGSWIVDDVRLLKSPAEVEFVRRAAAIADVSMRSLAETMRPGMTEIELAGQALAAMMREGGGDPAIRVAIRSGPRFVARHCAPSHRKLLPGDLVWVNFCGSYHRYHADLGRLFSLGPPDPRWSALIEQISEISDAVLNAIDPGAPTQQLQTAADGAVDAAGLRAQTALVGGYDLGIAIPPDWVGHAFIDAARGFRAASYDVGMVTNFEMLFTPGDDDWRGGSGGGFIDTVLMTDRGLEVLSGMDRAIRSV